MARVLIVGAGDIGGGLATALAEHHEVWALRRGAAQDSGNLRWIQADILDEEVPLQLPAELDLVIYSIASPVFSRDGYHDYYVNGMKNVMAALSTSSLKRFFFISSTSVYHQMHGEWVDETSVTEPAAFAGKEHLLAEQTLLESGLPGTVVRFTGIYGPGRNRLIEQARHGSHCDPEPPLWTNRIHRDDCIGVLQFLCERALRGEALDDLYLATDDEPATLFDVLEWIKDRLDDVDPDHDMPEATRRANRRCRNDRLKALGYQFKYPGFRDGYDEILTELGYS
ncbi:NAD-dependent epimerase/dehydratase family protein [Oceanobacter mangrovi]|uniref:NAD-dependent epimerase/dehydratase family protein n=1 Tax=Oceanobacter mangrovi TaxID=2862510 RepID=UPI001C8E9082|nr:NAD(P)H-binding protein [Oceanobacter mangrovi]